MHVEFADGDVDRFLLPMGFVADSDADWLRDQPQAVLARVHGADGDGWLIDAHWDHDYARALLDTIRRRRRLGGRRGSIVGRSTSALGAIDPADPDLTITVSGAEQSNTSILFGDRFVLKTFRRIDTGVNPELELGSFLTRRRFDAAPAVAGDLEYRNPASAPAAADASIAVLHEFVPNEGDAYSYTVRALGRFFDAVIGWSDDPRAVAALAATGPAWAQRDAEPPELLDQLAGEFLTSAETLGRQTAELHCTLASDADDPAFAPEPINALYQRGVYQSMRNSTRQRADRAPARRPRRSRRGGRGLRRRPGGDAADARPSRDGRRERYAHPHPWRPAPGSGALHRTGLHLHRLRG